MVTYCVENPWVWAASRRVLTTIYHEFDLVQFELSIVTKKDERSVKLIQFANLTGRGVNVAVVDSGIDLAHPKVGPVSGGVDISVGVDRQIVYNNDDYSDRTGHGTACAGIIRNKAPEIELFSVRIFDQSLSAPPEALVAAIQWATDQGVDIVNLCLGTSDVAFREAIAAACRLAVEDGIILVAAEHNDGLESYPAALSETIGVAGGEIYEKYGFFFRPDQTTECVARGDEQRVCWMDGREILVAGTSFAAPHITGIVALIKEAHPGANLDDVREILQANALDGTPHLVRESGERKPARRPVSLAVEEKSYQPNLGLIKKAACYPFNKEMHGMVRFRDLLNFEISAIADPAGKGQVGKDAGEAIGIAPAGIPILPRLKDALKGADTLILGYVDELTRIASRNLLKESIQAALDQGLHVFSFLSVPEEAYPDLHARAREKGLRIHYPDVPQDVVIDTLQRGHEEPLVDAPVLCVFGTSSQQGKFTVQLALRRKLIEKGYKVAQVGTEHHSELFGMDLAFPMGYASPLKLPLQVYVPYLDLKMREMCRKKRPEIILVGSQSGTIPYDLFEHDTHPLPTIAFLLGTKPDACILAVNSIDPDEYIQDTLNAIRALGKAPTIMLAMSDKEKHIRAAYGRTIISPRQLSRQEIQQKLLHLEQTFAIPAVEIVSEAGQQRMAETVTRHFAT